jgi:hypothetical protein
MIELDLILVVRLLVLLTVANGAPVIATKIFAGSFARPLDNSLILADGQPLFGPSKTWRGVVLAIAATVAFAPWIGFDWTTGLLVGVAAMIGDLVSSFVKRRMGLSSKAMALGLDQVPESLFPALLCRWVLPIDLAEIICVTVLFFVGELALSRILYALAIRDRPY